MHFWLPLTHRPVFGSFSLIVRLLGILVDVAEHLTVIWFASMDVIIRRGTVKHRDPPLAVFTSDILNDRRHVAVRAAADRPVFVFEVYCFH